MKRLLWIDNLKCFAIILVVLGHLIQFIYYPNIFDQNHLFRYIYSFHMPLFMIISGILVGLKSENNNAYYSLIKKRAIQLLIPFFSWGIISTCLWKSNIVNIIMYPDHGLWFLWALFYIYLAYLGTISISKVLNNYFVSFLFVYLVLKIISFYIDGLLGFNLISKYYFWYMVGVYIAQKKSLQTLCKNTYIPIYLTLFIILGFYWKRLDFSFIPFSEFKYNWLLNIIYRLITSISGILAIISIILSIKNTNFIIQYIGQKTLAIYAIHYFIIDLLKMAGFRNIETIIVTLPITIIASLFIEKILSKNRFSSFFLLGKYSNS